MSELFQNLRPGVYSRYDVTGGYPGTSSRRDAALVLKGEDLAPQIFTSFGQAAEVLADNALECVRLLLAGGVGSVVVARGDDVESTLSLLDSAAADIGCVVCRCETDDDFDALRRYVVEASAKMRECVGFCAVGHHDEALRIAALLNCERVALCCPGVQSEESEDGAFDPLWAACCLAAKALCAASPAQSLSGEEFPLLGGTQPLTEEVIQQLLAAGVCVFEETGGGVELIRAMTTRTRANGAPDDSLRGLNTVLIIDDVVRHIRGCLKERMKGAGTSSMGSVRDQVTVELAAKKDAGIISGFDPPRVSADSSDPTVCLVEMSFSVAHLVSRIHITAHIQV